MGRAFEYRKATKLKRWGHMAKTFTRLGKQIAIAVKAGGPEPENNPALRSVIATCKRENMPKDNIERAIKNAMGKDQSDYKGMTYEGYGPHGIAVFVDTLTDNPTRTVADVRSVFNKFGGKCYIGQASWNMLYEKAGKEMSLFIQKYIYPPIQAMGKFINSKPQSIQIRNCTNEIIISDNKNEYKINRK